MNGGKAMRCALIYALVLVLYLWCSGISPSSGLAAEDGRALAQKVYDRDTGKSSYAKVEMVLMSKQGNERTRTMVVAMKNYGKGHKRYIRFTEPASIAGTAFLAWENEDRSDDQFLYLPELERVRRIVSTQKDHSFVNSDFTYEDLEKRKVDKDTQSILRSESYEQYECWVLESIPKADNASQYGKLVSWVAKDALIPVKVEFYDKQNRLTKRLVVKRLERIDKIWTALETEMYDLTKDHRTRLKTLEIRYNQGVVDRVFTEAYLQKPQ
jgi:outer membrane lipoprotein-sorting protein